MKKIFINHRIFKAALFLGIAYLLVSCQVGKTQAGDNMDAGDTIPMKYAQHLTIVKHGEEDTEVLLANPWKEGTLLHRYILVPKGKEGNERPPTTKCRSASEGDVCLPFHPQQAAGHLQLGGLGEVRQDAPRRAGQASLQSGCLGLRSLGVGEGGKRGVEFATLFLICSQNNINTV